MDSNQRKSTPLARGQKRTAEEDSSRKQKKTLTGPNDILVKSSENSKGEKCFGEKPKVKDLSSVEGQITAAAGVSSRGHPHQNAIDVEGNSSSSVNVIRESEEESSPPSRAEMAKDIQEMKEAMKLMNSRIQKLERELDARKQESGEFSNQAGLVETKEGSVFAALQNELVLDHLSSYLSTKDLGNCRLVSKTWNDCLTPIFRKTAVVTRIGKFVEWKLDNPNCKDFELHPFQKFHVDFDAWQSPDARLTWEEVLLRLLSSCAPVMSSLRISGFYEREYRSNKLSSELVIGNTEELRFPRLKSLMFEGLRLGLDRNGWLTHASWILQKILGESATRPTNLTSWEVHTSYFETHDWLKLANQLFLLSPNLKTLRFLSVGEIVFRNSYSDLQSQLSSLVPVRKEDATKFAIQTLDVLMMNRAPGQDLTREFVATLRELQFPLATLTLDVGETTRGSTISALLDLFKGTLKKLFLFRGNHSQKAYKNFPFKIEFPSLRILRISNRIISNLHFLPWMPKLAELEICSGYDKECFYDGTFFASRSVRNVYDSIVVNTEDELMENVRMEMLLELRFDFRIPPSEIKRLARWMPNLERLNILVYDPKKEKEYLNEVCDHFRKLKQLTIRRKVRSGERVCSSRLGGLKGLQEFTMLPIVDESSDACGSSSEDEEETSDSQSSEEEEEEAGSHASEEEEEIDNE